ncbi:hypothetical protein [Mesorhizobium sp. A556]
MSTNLLTDIDQFLRQTGMGEYRFGILAVSNGRLLERLRTPRSNGQPARVWPETEAQIRSFMAERARSPMEKTA